MRRKKMNWNPDEHYKSHQVAAEYDKRRFSSFPGRVFNYLEKRMIGKCFRGVATTQKIVDVPCGTGRLAEALLAYGYSVHGMDISEQMLDVARQRLSTYGSRFTTEAADVKKLPAQVEMYDGALCARVLMHFPLDQQIEFLTGVARLSGSVVVINHSLDSGYQRLRRRLKRLLGHQESAGHPINNRDISVLLKNSGLREVKRRRLLPIISEAVYIVAKKTDIATSRTQ
jgi:ubiquinone/menaquinone biosynthesis C-methylase UbiE